MGTEILKSFGALQSELEQAKNSLKGVDESIKRLIGRDPSELPPRPTLKRPPPNEDRGRPNRNVKSRAFLPEEEPPAKRRTGVSVFKRLSERPLHYKDELPNNRQMISKVIVTPKEIPSRQEALAAQNTDEKSKARNRRMFGALLGTLQKFQQEETKLKQREEKRAQLEKKIEEHEIKEKEEIKKERQSLFLNRKKKQAEIKMIELKMLRMKEFSMWEDRQKPRMNFIKTKAKPHIHYLPRKMNDPSKKLLESCKVEIQKLIDSKKQDICDELHRIEERMKRNFEEKVLRKEDKQEDHEEEEEDEEDQEHYHDRPNNEHVESEQQQKDSNHNDSHEKNASSTPVNNPEDNNQHENKNDYVVETPKDTPEDADLANNQAIEETKVVTDSRTVEEPITVNLSENGNPSLLSWGDIPLAPDTDTPSNTNTDTVIGENVSTTENCDKLDQTNA